MEPTHVKPDKNLSLPINTVPFHPAACQRAPTLMAGETAGSQGKVEVWAPDAREVWKKPLERAIRFCFFVCGTTLIELIRHGNLELNPFVVFWFVPAALSGALALATLRRPPYLTLDEAGIGVVTWRGSHALRWSDIHSVESKLFADYPRLKITGPRPVTIRLNGYSSTRQHDLLSILIRRANLKADPGRMLCFVRSPGLPVGESGSALMASSSQP